PGAERGGSLDFVNALLRRWRLVAGLPLLAAILTAIVVLLLPPRYTATVTFVPEQRTPTRGGGAGGAAGGGLVGLAGQLGIPLGMDPTQSPRFYAEVLTSRELLARVLLTKFPDPRRPAAGDSVPLLAILRVWGGIWGAKSAADSLDRGVRKLRRRVSARVDIQTFLVYLSVTTRYPDLSAEEGRVHMQVNILQEVYLTLRRDYEQARIEEVNDTPVITVVDPAVPPQRQSYWREVLVLLAFVFGGLIGVLGAWSGVRFERLRREDEDGYRELTGLLQRLRREVARPFSR